MRPPSALETGVRPVPAAEDPSNRRSYDRIQTPSSLVGWHHTRGAWSLFPRLFSLQGGIFSPGGPLFQVWWAKVLHWSEPVHHELDVLVYKYNPRRSFSSSLLPRLPPGRHRTKGRVPIMKKMHLAPWFLLFSFVACSCAGYAASHLSWGCESFPLKDSRRSTASDRAAAVKQAFQTAWDGYKNHAFPHDQLHPLTNSFDDGL